MWSTSRTIGMAIGMAAISFGISSCTSIGAEGNTNRDTCAVELIVLGTGQDAGAPQIGNKNDPAWADPSLRLTATSVAIVDHDNNSRYLLDATPHITEQLQLLDTLAPIPREGLGIQGVFLTHAHIGHYAGLMFFGREAAGARKIPVFATRRMSEYLINNGPWSQLVDLQNIIIAPQISGTPNPMTGDMTFTPLQVPHRDEFSDTVGLLIETPGKDVLYLPDIDQWDTWEADYGYSLEDIIQTVDLAYVDATFYDDNELPGRDMTKIPHPRVTETMERLADFPDEVRARIQFIHTNHTNPIRFQDSAETKTVLEAGFGIARAGQIHCLVD